MKYLLVSLILLTFPAANTLAQNKDTSPHGCLIWSDEFDGHGLPDPAFWSYETGFIRNQEMQYYTKARRKNVRIKKGYLEITARKEKFKNPAYDPASKDWRKNREYAQYTSASITTQCKFTMRYGRIEVRARVPDGQGTWPAIWLLGANISQVGWPACGEIDIMEFLGRDSLKVYGTAHWAANAKGKHKSAGKNISVQPPPSAGFHVYAIDWSPDTIRFYYDDRMYFAFDVNQAGRRAENPFRKPFYLILNLAMGGWGGKIDDAALPQKFLIDYVRGYGGTMNDACLPAGRNDD